VSDINKNIEEAIKNRAERLSKLELERSSTDSQEKK
jgi:hypothetical protein